MVMVVVPGQIETGLVQGVVWGWSGSLPAIQKSHFFIHLTVLGMTQNAKGDLLI